MLGVKSLFELSKVSTKFNKVVNDKQLLTLKAKPHDRYQLKDSEGKKRKTIKKLTPNGQTLEISPVKHKNYLSLKKHHTYIKALDTFIFWQTLYNMTHFKYSDNFLLDFAFNFHPLPTNTKNENTPKVPWTEDLTILKAKTFKKWLDDQGDVQTTKEISLGSFGIQFLPKEIGQFTCIKTLNLNGNLLKSLPSIIVNLTELNYLHLTNNLFGSLPLAITELKNLKALNLENNLLTTLPEKITQLKKLHFLNLSKNPLGVFPKQVFNLKNLKFLFLEKCQLNSIPPEIGTMTDLKILNLSGNQLKEIPFEIEKLENLTELCLNDNQLSYLPSALLKLPKLEKLVIYNNPKLLKDRLSIQLIERLKNKNPKVDVIIKA